MYIDELAGLTVRTKDGTVTFMEKPVGPDDNDGWDDDGGAPVREPRNPKKPMPEDSIELEEPALV